MKYPQHNCRFRAMIKLLFLLPAFMMLLLSNKSSAACKANFYYVTLNDSIITFYDSSSSTYKHTCYWSFGDGTTSTSTGKVTHYYKRGKTYTACLVIYDSTASCADTICKSIKINSNCKVSFSYSLSNNTLSTTNNSSISNYYWRFGDGTTSNSKNPAHTYAKPGYYNLCLAIYDSSINCSDSMCKTIYIGNSAFCDAKFTYSVSGLSVSFTDFNYTDSRHKRSWNFGDGTTSSAHNPTHTFSKAGTYYVCLAMKDSLYCQDSFCTKITVSNSCHAYFTYSASGLGITLNDSSYSPNKHTVLWTYGDGTSGIYASYKYKNSGTYTVCQIIKDTTAHCTDTFCRSITVSSGCLAKASYNISGLKVNFSDSSKAGPHKTQWTFGDGTTSSSPSPSHTYAKSGTYTVCLYITDSTHCTSSYCFSVKVSIGCHADFYYYTANNIVSFYDTSYSPYAYLRVWQFGDGTTSTIQRPKHTYTVAGNYHVCLYITDTAAHCADSICRYITVKGGCRSSFYYTASGKQISFHDNSTALNAYKTYWSFGDGNTSTAQNPVHTYTYGGKYTVCLVIYDSAAKCMDTSCLSITVTGSCHAGFSYSATGKQVTFTDKSTSDKSHTVRWTFGDGTSGTSSSPTHTYAAYGSYGVCLAIMDSSGNCRDTFCDKVVVKPACNPKFHYSVKGLTVKLEADTSNASSAQYEWNFGDNNTDSGRSVTHTYSEDSTYYVCLRMKDTVNNCSDSFCTKITAKTPYYKISGKICTDSVTYSNAIVKLIVFDPTDSSLDAIDSQKVYMDSSCAYYMFSYVREGTYYVKAFLTNKNKAYKKYMPTYHDSALKWKDAQKIVIDSNSVSNADIYLIKGHNPGGKGFISGKISQGANKKEGDPISGVTVLLFNSMGQPVSFDISDLNGLYKIDSLPNGRYEVYPEIPGLRTYSSWVELTDAKHELQDVDITVNTKDVETSIFQISGKGYEEVKLYPNPVHDVLSMQLNSNKAQTAVLIVSDISGKVLHQECLKLQPGDQYAQMKVNGLSKGFYLLKVVYPDGHLLQSRFMKD